ncbi:MAG: hypothetical protein ACK55I_13400, partial [bacterium]
MTQLVFNLLSKFIQITEHGGRLLPDRSPLLLAQSAQIFCHERGTRIIRQRRGVTFNEVPVQGS